MIIIPTYNEKENIPELIRRIRAVLPAVRILFIDDGSPDGTTELLKEYTEKDSNLNLIVRPEKAGLGSAYREAFRWALSHNTDEIVLTMDADHSHSPEALPELIGKLENHDVVIGSRYIAGGKITNWNILRKLLSKCANLYAKILTGKNVADLTGGFNGYKVSALQNLNLESIASDGYAFQIELKNILIDSGATYTETPITFSERDAGKSKLSGTVISEGIAYPLKAFFGRLRKDPSTFIPPLMSFLLPLILYALTAPHTIFTNDNAEFITAAATGGIVHPSGYPLYLMLSWIFAHLPLGSIPFRVNFFTSICSAGAMLVLYSLFRQIFSLIDQPRKWHNWVAMLGVATLALTRIIWFQSEVAKVYSLNLLLILICVWLALRFLQSKRISTFYWFALISGLAFSVHQMSILITPFIGLIFLTDKKLLKIKMLAQALGLFFLGLTPYLYIPLRAAFHPELDWGHINNLSSFLHLVTRAQYNDLHTAVISTALKSKIDFLGAFALNVWNQFGWLLLFLPLGITRMLLTNKKLFYLFSIIIIANTVGIISLRSLNFNYEAAEFYSTYYLPAYTFIFLFIVLGLILASKVLKGFAPALSMIVLAVASILLFRTNFPANNLRTFTFIDDYSRASLQSLPPNSVLLFNVDNPGEDTALFSLAYQKYINKLRPDVQIVAYIDVFPQSDNRTVDHIFASTERDNRESELYAYALKNYPGRSILTTFISGSSTPPANAVKLSPNDEQILSRDYFGRQVISNYYYLQAANFATQKNRVAAGNSILKAIEFDTAPYSTQLAQYDRLRNSVFIK